MAIIAAVDESDRASVVVEEAERLAEKFDEAVHIVHAVKRSEAVDAAFPGGPGDGEIDVAKVRAEAKKPAEKVANDMSVSYECIGLIGKAAPKIVEYANEQDARYIVVSPRKRSRTGKALFGSTAQSILLNSTCPVVSTIKDHY